MSTPFGKFFFPFVGFVAFLVAAYLLFVPVPQVSVPSHSGGSSGNTADVDWNPHPENPPYEGVTHLFAQVSSSVQPGDTLLDPGMFNLPTPPEDHCKMIQALTGAPCTWEIVKRVSKDGNNEIYIRLKSGDYVISESQYMELELGKFPELGTSSFQNLTRGWFSHIQTAKWLEGLGFGKLLWSATDQVAKQLSGGQALHIFADHAGWWSALSKNLDPAVIKVVGDRLYLYLIP